MEEKQEETIQTVNQPDEKTEWGMIRSTPIVEEMEKSYLDYAMSVIVSRALPDVRDGLKPVHRRILFAMKEMNLTHKTPYKKSARIVGEVLGKYHPHGDQAAYQTLARLAQEFSMRYPLIDGQGNFGSIDGDSAAAMRYTEARLSKISSEILEDIDKNTVDFIDNFDGSQQEPLVLPAKLPNLLLMGSDGIAVGMATKIPPHNLLEVVAALKALIDKSTVTRESEVVDEGIEKVDHRQLTGILDADIEIDELCEYIKGPDFPTRGIIYDTQEIKNLYHTGKANIINRGVAEIVEKKSGRFQILITELPYQVNKAKLITNIAELVKNKKLIGIADLRDESDRKGIRIAVDLKRDAYPRKVLNQLFKLTSMQSSFHVNLLALVDGIQPRVLDLRGALQQFVAPRRVVVTRRTQFELKKAEERAHILEGFKIALQNIDAVIKTIKQSATKEDAHTNLKKKFKLTDIQTAAILEMRLSALAGLERQKVEDEYKDKQKLIKELKAILADAKKVDAIIKGECAEIKDKYGDERRTKISNKTVGEFTDMDLIPNEEVVVTMSVGGYIKRQQSAEFRTQRRGGKGVIGMTTKEEDQIEIIQSTQNHDDIFFFTNRGRVFRQKVYEIPQSSRIAKGTAIVNVIQLAPEELVTTLLTMPTYKAGDNLVMITRRGVIKKTEAEKYANIRANGLIAIKLDAGDELKWVKKSRKQDSVVIMTKEGQSIRFEESDARLLGRSTRGVRGIKLRPHDEVISADVAKPDGEYVCLVIAEKGLGKRTNLNQYSIQKRGGIGVKTMHLTDRTGKIVGGELVERTSTADLIITSKNGQVIRTPLSSVPMLGRVTQGVTLMRLKSGDKVASFSIIAKDGEEGMSEEKTPASGNGSAPKSVGSKSSEEKKSSETAPASVKNGKTFMKRQIASTGLKERVSKLAQKSKGFVQKKISAIPREQSKPTSRLSKKRKH